MSGSSLLNTPNLLLSVNLPNRPNCSKYVTFKDLSTVNWQWFLTKETQREIYILQDSFLN